MDLIRRLTQDSAPAPRSCFTVGVCPVESGTHAARMSAELGLMAAKQSSSSRILVVETSAKRDRSAFSSVFNLAADAPGLAEMLAPPPHNRFDTIHPTQVPGLFAMPAGRMTRPPARAQLEWMHSVLNRHFQGIVIELPAMGELFAKELCSSIPNAVVLVTYPGCGSMAIRRAVRRLRSANLNIVGSSIVR